MKFLLFSMNFGSLNDFLKKNYLIEENQKNKTNPGLHSGPRPQPPQVGSPRDSAGYIG
jgi:hypothetical protein